MASDFLRDHFIVIPVVLPPPKRKVRVDLDGCSRTDRNNFRNAYRILLQNGHDRAFARQWVADRIAEHPEMAS